MYRRKVDSGEIRPDADQARAIEALSRLSAQLGRRGRWLSARLPRFLFSFAPRGFYFYGDVGRGKSMVMDLFFAQAPVKKKRRVHFHAFMLEVHDFLFSFSARDGLDGGLIAFAGKIAHEAQLLCFDEFFVKDVADAMILGRLFTALFRKGVTVVMTSNVAPDDLYADGLQRDRFLPFIALLKQRLEIFRFGGAEDYRLGALRDSKLYFWPADEDAGREMDKLFDALAEGRAAEAQSIAVKGRVIRIPRAARGVADFTFEELCGENKSALDYLEIVKRYKVILLRGVPRLSDERRDATLRFITLIDTLYDNHARLVVSAAAAPDKLYRGEFHAAAFPRTVSRLTEMQSVTY